MESLAISACWAFKLRIYFNKRRVRVRSQASSYGICDTKIGSGTGTSVLSCLFHFTNSPSIGIATCYGLDGPGIESRWGREFPHPPRPDLRPLQPPIQWAPDLSRGWSCRGVTLTTHSPSSAEVKERVELYLYSPSGPSWPVLLYHTHSSHLSSMLYSLIVPTDSVITQHN